MRKNRSKRTRVPMLALPFAAVIATIGLVELGYRVFAGPFDPRIWRTFKLVLDARELARVREVPGMRQPNSFSELSPLRDQPLRHPFRSGLTLASVPGPAAWRRPGDPLSGLQPGKRRETKVLSDGTTVFDVEVGIDSHGRRETSNPNPRMRKKYLIVSGCSFTYGSGVRDEQTLPSRLAAALPGYRAYNYGVYAAGPDYFVSRLDALERWEDIPEVDGTMLYLMIPDHVRRTNPSLEYYAGRAPLKEIYWEPDAEGNLRKVNGYYNEHWLSGLLMGLLSHSAFLAYHHINLPPTYGISEVRRLAKLAAGMDRLYRAKFHNDRFLVVIYPSAGATALGTLLGEAGVKYLDYGSVELGRYTREPPTLHSRDEHPSAEAYDLVAKQIAHDLFGRKARPSDRQAR